MSILLAVLTIFLTSISSLSYAAMEVKAPLTEQMTVVQGVTTNTTSTTVRLPSGPKSFKGQVVCTSGACVQTQDIYGNNVPAATNGILLCTLTLTATTRDDDACPVVTANFKYYYVTTTNTSGTAATGAVYVGY